MTRFTAGWATPGCLPDTTEPLPEFDTSEQAVKYLAENVERFWDEDYAGGPDCDHADHTIMGARYEHCPIHLHKVEIDARWLPAHTALHTGCSSTPSRSTDVRST